MGEFSNKKFTLQSNPPPQKFTVAILDGFQTPLPPQGEQEGGDGRYSTGTFSSMLSSVKADSSSTSSPHDMRAVTGMDIGRQDKTRSLLVLVTLAFLKALAGKMGSTELVSLFYFDLILHLSLYYLQSILYKNS